MSLSYLWAWRLAVAGLVASAAVPGAVRSQGRDTTAARDSAVVLSRVEVHASIAPTAGVAVGSGVPARITVIGERELEAWRPRLLGDLLASQAGVSVYDDLGSPYKLNLSTRGFSVGPTVGLPPGISVFLDGVRQNEPAAQEVNFDLLPMEHVAQVELLSGTASLLGPNSLGGAVNLVTRRGGGTPGGEIALSGGSFGAYAAEATAAGGARGWDYYAGGSYERERGWREATGARNASGFVNLARRGAARGASLQAYAAHSRAETAGSLPESIFRTAPRANFTAGDFEELSAGQLALGGYAPVARGSGSVTAYVRRSEAERFNVNQPPDPDVRGLTTNLTAGATADWRRAVTLGRSALALRVGLDAAANRVRVRILNEGGTDEEAGDAADAGAPRRLTTDVRSPSRDLAAYALADWRAGRVTLSAGARVDHVRVPFENEIERADRTTNTYRQLSPRGGVSVDLGRGASLYASAGRSFRAPAILELGCADPEAACPLPFALGEDPPLRPVRASTYEAGARWAAGPLFVTGSVYRTGVRDEIFFVAAPDALLSGHFTNLERTRREGAELSAQAVLWGDRVLAWGNYAWTRATFHAPAALFSLRSEDEFADHPLAGPNRVERGDRLPLVPEHQLKGGALARLPRGVALGLDARYVGRQWLRGDEANETEPLGGYAAVSARASYGAGGWEVAAIATNLLDARDAVFGTFNENRRSGELERFLTPLTARTVRLVVRRELGGRAGAAGSDP